MRFLKFRESWVPSHPKLMFMIKMELGAVGKQILQLAAILHRPGTEKFLEITACLQQNLVKQIPWPSQVWDGAATTTGRNGVHFEKLLLGIGEGIKLRRQVVKDAGVLQELMHMPSPVKRQREVRFLHIDIAYSRRPAVNKRDIFLGADQTEADANHVAEAATSQVLGMVNKEGDSSGTALPVTIDRVWESKNAHMGTIECGPSRELLRAPIFRQVSSLVLWRDSESPEVDPRKGHNRARGSKGLELLWPWPTEARKAQSACRLI